MSVFSYVISHWELLEKLTSFAAYYSLIIKICQLRCYQSALSFTESINICRSIQLPFLFRPVSLSLPVHSEKLFDTVGLIPDTNNCRLRMRRECRELFSRRRLQRKTLVSDPGMYHGTYVTHVPWCLSGSPTRGGGENVPGIPGACATRDFAYLARGPWLCCCNNSLT